MATDQKEVVITQQSGAIIYRIAGKLAREKIIVPRFRSHPPVTSFVTLSHKGDNR
jgi:hypothetical protein